MQDKEEGARRWAAEALGKRNDGRAVEPLVKALTDDDHLTRSLAADALDRHDVAFESLVSYLEDGNERVRRWAAYALGNLGDDRAVDRLIRALDDGETVRLSALESLAKLGNRRSVEPLIAILDDADVSARRYAATALGRIGDPRATEALIDTMREDPSEAVRCSVVEALGELGDARSTEPLIQVLTSRYPDTKCLAAVALGKIGDPKAYKALSDASNDPSVDVRQAAAQALRGLRPDQTGG
jgi:HEAT repeat protein